MKNTFKTLRLALYRINFHANTPATRGFDIALIFLILASVLALR